MKAVILSVFVFAGTLSSALSQLESLPIGNMDKVLRYKTNQVQLIEGKLYKELYSSETTTLPRLTWNGRVWVEFASGPHVGWNSSFENEWPLGEAIQQSLQTFLELKLPVMATASADSPDRKFLIKVACRDDTCARFEYFRILNEFTIERQGTNYSLPSEATLPIFNYETCDIYGFRIPGGKVYQMKTTVLWPSGGTSVYYGSGANSCRQQTGTWVCFEEEDGLSAYGTIMGGGHEGIVSLYHLGPNITTNSVWTWDYFDLCDGQRLLSKPLQMKCTRVNTNLVQILVKGGVIAPQVVLEASHDFGDWQTVLTGTNYIGWGVFTLTNLNQCSIYRAKLIP